MSSIMGSYILYWYGSTADSLHIGHYSSLLMAKRLEKHGHHPIMLVGGATGFIEIQRQLEKEVC